MSKKNISRIISGMGVGLSILQILDEERRAVGVSDEEFHKLVTPQGRIYLQQLAKNLKRSDAESDKFSEMIAAGTMIVHRGVKVDRNRTPQEVIAATGRKQYVNDKAVASMPRGQGDVVDLYYIKRDDLMRDDDWEKYLKQLGLTCDPCAQATDNEANPAFADDHPNGTHWKNSKGEWCFSVFRRWGDDRHVYVDRNDHGWLGNWWFGGRKLVL